MKHQVEAAFPPLDILTLTDVAEAPCNWEGWSSPGNTPRMGLREARQLVNAEAFSSRRFPLTAHATVRCERSASYSPEQSAAWRGRFLDKTSRFLFRNGVKPAYLWIVERGPQSGEHLHLMLHLPDFEMRSRLHRFMVESGGFDFGADATGYAVKISGGLFGMRSPYMRAGCLRYVCKTMAPGIADQLGIRPVADVLPVTGRRFGVSHSIGAAAREAAGWRELREVVELHRHLNPLVPVLPWETGGRTRGTDA